jgi:PilZ domain
LILVKRSAVLKLIHLLPLAGPQVEVVMNSDRRSAPRLKMAVPLRFRSLKTPSIPEHEAASLNISNRGVYFTTDGYVSRGLLIQVLLKMPREASGEEDREWRFTGRVAHVQPLGFSKDAIGVGVQFLYYETPQTAD